MDPLLQAARLADIEHLAIGGDHPVDAGLAGKPAHEVANDLGPRRGGGLGRGVVCVSFGHGCIHQLSVRQE
jgi:hypothetical protein